MKIAKYISDLLYKHECVVIPGLGGFITNYASAEIHPVQHNFTPPSKNIVFNVHLKTNDGLLINHIALSEKISYIEAKYRITKFVERCHIELNNGKKINFHSIGVLYHDFEGNTQFDRDKSVNYLEDSFGMTSFISPAIKRETIQQKFEKKIAERQTIRPITKKRIPSTTKWAAVLALPVMAVTTWGYIDGKSLKNVYTNDTSLIPSLNAFTNNTPVNIDGFVKSRHSGENRSP